MTEKEYDNLNCPYCGGSGHIDDCDVTTKKVKSALESAETDRDSLKKWGGENRDFIDAVTAALYADFPHPLIEQYMDSVAKHDPHHKCLHALRERLQRSHKLKKVADAADVVMHHFVDAHFNEESFTKMFDAMESLRVALNAAGYGLPSEAYMSILPKEPTP